MPRAKYDVLTWEVCEKALSKRPQIKIAPNTVLRKELSWQDPLGRIHKEAFVATFYDTPIVGVLRDGKRVLNSGGHRTHTTKERLKRFGGGHVYAKAHEWYINKKLFFDGFTLGEHDQGQALALVNGELWPLGQDDLVDYLERTGKVKQSGNGIFLGNSYPPEKTQVCLWCLPLQGHWRFSLFYHGQPVAVHEQLDLAVQGYLSLT